MGQKAANQERDFNLNLIFALGGTSEGMEE
jgi:hypothetical protein